MKKIISFLIAVVLIFSCLGLSVSAKNTMLVSDDFNEIYYEEEKYYRINDSFYTYETSESHYDVTCVGNKDVSSADLEISTNDNIINAYMQLTNGGTLDAYYIREGAHAQLMEWKNETEQYIIEFEDDIIADKSGFKGELTVINGEDVYDYDEFFIKVEMPDQSFEYIIGEIIIIEDEYYYLNFEAANVSDPYNFYITDQPNISLLKITDAKLCGQIQTAYEDYKENSLSGILGSATENIGNVFLILAFIIIPTVLFVLFAILARKAKGVYKKFFRIIYISSAATLVISVAVLIIVTVFKA